LFSRIHTHTHTQRERERERETVTRELPGERDNARNDARCTQSRKTTHGVDGQHQHVDRTARGRVSRNDRGQRQKEKYVHDVANARIEDG